ncbi:MAG: VWA domain-containing protein [bacterium]|nr:VWA domain-containing protein [bacterium]
MRADFYLDYDVLTVQRPYKLHLMARLSSGPASDERVRRPLNLSLVIDRSGSMAGEKIDYTRQAAQFLVQNLGARDILSIVLYNDTVETLLMPEKVQRKDVIAQRIASIKASGTTNLSSGWLEGVKLVNQNLDDVYVNRVILMSDGLANRGVTSTEQLVTMAQQKFQEKVSTTTMGLGTDFNEDLMMAMANAGGGAFYFIETPEVTPLIFKEELQGLLNVMGQNLVITVETTENVRLVDQLNAYPMQTDGRRVSFRLGDVFGDEVKGLLLELSVMGLPELGQQRIATLKFEYDELTEKGSVHRTWEMPVTVNVVADTPKSLPNPDVRQSVLLLQAAQARKLAVKEADKGQFNTAAQILREMAKAIDAESMSSDPLTEEHKALLAQAYEMDKGESYYSGYSRKTMSTQAFYTMTSRHEDTVMLRVREGERQPDRRTQTDIPVQPHDDEIKIEKREGVVPTMVTWKDKVFKLKGDLIRIGRSTHNEIIIGASGVSRFHCQVRRDGEQLLLEDLGSTNGTMVGGTLLKEPHVLNVGDVAYLCDEKLIFHDGM